MRSTLHSTSGRRTRARAIVLVGALLTGACTSGAVERTSELPPSPGPSVGADEAGRAAAVSTGPGWPTDGDWFATGFQDYPVRWGDNDDMTAGFSMFVAVWPLQETYPGPDHQTGLPGTWLVPTALDGVDGENYSTIEGGLGWWNDTRFATETPKFVMGGVARNFVEWANGPGAGGGTADVDRRDWDQPQGKYGVAQLSPSVLWAPDGLNLEQGTNGAWLGYGYQPLPLIDAQPRTAGTDLATGDRSWTLFLQAGNFAGPVSFFVPNFFSKPALADPSLEGAFFDSSPMDPNRSIAMETQVIPAAHAIGPDGAAYARITRTQFPATEDDSSIVVSQVSSYSHAALWDPTVEWFDGGEPVVPLADERAVHVSPFDLVDAREASTWIIIFEGIDEAEEYPIDWGALAEIDVSDPLIFRYRWNLDLVERVDDRFVLPEYYRLERTADGALWHPIVEAELPPGTGLDEHRFPELGVRNDTEPLVTPSDDELWTTPGPVAGPFHAEVGDGTVLTYSWYRFVDQPAIRYWDFSAEQLDRMQARAEAIHRAWGPDRTYLAPPSTGDLANLDPAVIVTPPPGLEVGHVPIVTRQERAGA